MFKVIVTIFIIGIVMYSTAAEVKVNGSAAVQVTKKGGDHSKGRLDDSWSRGEIKIKGKHETGLSGLLHLRFEPKMSEGTKTTPIQPRQVYFKLPITTLEITAGRWYEIYTNCGYYFGRYLFGVDDKGSGAMNTDYSIIDGVKAALNFEEINSALQLGLLPQDNMFEHTRLFASFGGSPVEGFDVFAGGNFDVMLPDSVETEDAKHRATINSAITLVKDLKFKIFGEASIVDFNNASENAWFLFGITSTIPGVLDRVQAEFEIKNFRNGATDSESNLCWMVLLRKKVMKLCFDLNIGADQKSLGSKTADEVGVIFRTSAKF